MKCGLDNKVILTWTVAVFSKLFPIRLQHSTDQLSHPKWGWWFCSGLPGAINTGNIFLGHNRKAVIPTMRLTWTSALDIDPVSVPMATHIQKWISTRQWLTAEFCPPLPFPLPLLPLSSPLFLVLPTACLSGGGGEEKKRVPSAQGQGPDGRRAQFFSDALYSWSPEKLAPHRNAQWSSLAKLSLSAIKLSFPSYSSKSFSAIAAPIPTFIFPFLSQM